MSNHRGNTKVRLAVHLALAGSAVAAMGVASAQQQEGGAVMEEVIVTGSRIAAAPNQVSISPVIAISPLELKQSGATRVEDLINQLPQVFASQGAAISNGSDGTANVDLRGLLAKRTLVLVNGRRLGPGDPLASADLNQIPAQMIERVEVLTGGASSAYGADAVAGVVNFTLNNHFEGVRFTANYGFYQHHNDNPQGVRDDLRAWNAAAGTNFAEAPSNANSGYTKDLSFMVGFNAPEGNGNLTAFATYRKVDGVLQDKFDYSACSLGSGYTNGSYDTGGRFYCAGSSTSTPGRFRLVNATGQTIGGSRTLDPLTNQLIPFGNFSRYNFGPLNYYQRPDERWTAGALAHYQFSEHADVYTEVQYVNDRTVSQIAPSGAFYGTGPYKVNCGNPYFSTSMVTQWCGGVANPNTDIFLLVGRRNVEGSARRDDLEHQAFRLVLGSKGSITDAWNYDVYGQLGITQLAEDYQNDVSISRVRNALDVVTDGSGNIVCKSVVNGVDPTCVPWNIWQVNSVTPEALAYIRVPLVQRGEVQQKIVSAETTGDLSEYGWKLPSASSGVKVNIGAAWSQLATSLVPDLTYQLGDAAGQGSPTPPVNGTITAREVFLEARVPLADEKTGAYALAFETGYRYSDYNLGFSTNTYKFGLQWSPIRDIRLRGSWARAVRAPNAQELFQPRFIGLNGTADFCAGASPTFTAIQCAAQGVSAAQYGNIDANPAFQYNGRIGGDPTLQPETATTKSFGIGWTPSFVENLRVQVDYYDIDIKDTIQRVGNETTQTLCSNQGLFCNRINRDVNGTLWVSSTDAFIDDPLANQGALATTGVDLDMSYGFAIGSYGKINMGLVGTYLDSYEFTSLQSLPSTKYDCAGYYGATCNANVNAPLYKWRHTLRTTWSTPWHGLDVSLAWRYWDSVKLDLLSSNPNMAVSPGAHNSTTSTGAPCTTVDCGAISSTDAKIASVNYFDLSGAIDITDKINFRLGINNLLDKNPPVIGSSSCSGCNGNVYSQTYDTLGRYWFGTLTVDF
jgi:outer membrane receptor protein involved in Fe transport